MTRMFELTMESKFDRLTPDQKVFFAKKIIREVNQLAQEKNITNEEAYDLYNKGLYGADRQIEI